MAKLIDDPKVQALVEKAETRGRNEERKRINALLKDASEVDPDLDAGAKKAVKAALKDIKTGIRESA